MILHKILGDTTQEEAFSRENPDIGHLRIFGCPNTSMYMSRKG